MIFRYAILIIEWVTLEYVVVSNKGYNDLKKYIVLVIYSIRGRLCMYIVYRPKRHKWTVVVVCTRGTMPVPSHDTEAALLAWLSKDCQGCMGLWSSMYILSSSSRKASPSLENAWNGSKFGATLHYPSTMHAPPPFAYTHYNIFLLCSIYCKASNT